LSRVSRAHVSAVESLGNVAPLFAALGDETRLNIVARLCAAGPQSIVRLTDGTKVSRQAVTKHLHALAKAGLVRSTRDGRERIWQLQTKRLADVRSYLDQISTQWDDAIERLRTLVEHEP
jgi:DNA-binding transcriptional ArsR family regulator